MLKKIRGVNYKTKEVVELEVSVLTTCAWEGCKNAAITAIVFDDPYPLGDQTLQGEFHLCREHVDYMFNNHIANQ